MLISPEFIPKQTKITKRVNWGVCCLNVLFNEFLSTKESGINTKKIAFIADGPELSLNFLLRFCGVISYRREETQVEQNVRCRELSVDLGQHWAAPCFQDQDIQHKDCHYGKRQFRLRLLLPDEAMKQPMLLCVVVHVMQHPLRDTFETAMELPPVPCVVYALILSHVRQQHPKNELKNILYIKYKFLIFWNNWVFLFVGFNE